MSRVLLIGVGTPGYTSALRHHGPGLRTEHFANALIASGAQVLVVSVFPGADAPPVPQLEVSGPSSLATLTTLTTLTVAELDFSSSAVRQHIDAFGPDCVVGATVYAAKLALDLELGLPLWADVFGDLMAEAQAKAFATGDDWALVHFWTLLRPVLEKADRFSAVSCEQASALIGQLGVAGRLSSATASQRLVEVVPCAAKASCAPAGAAVLRGKKVPENAFVVLWSGGFNTWCDVDVLFDALALIMDEAANVYFVATGGAIPGHDEQTHARAIARVRMSRHRDRIHLLGWVAASEASEIAREADIGIVVERDLYERQLGSENRVVRWAAQGLPTVSTARSPLGRALVLAGAGLAASPANANGVANAVLRCVGEPDLAVAMGAKASQWAIAEADMSTTAEPLVRWCANPVRAGDNTGAPRLLTIGLLSRPETAIEFLEAYLARLSLAQLGHRTARWLVRRLLASSTQLVRKMVGAGAKSSPVEERVDVI
ncbi:MAG: glycosyltransferase involved in cell wall biosynthesis [Hyphomicrobiaceae bacterium]